MMGYKTPKDSLSKIIGYPLDTASIVNAVPVDRKINHSPGNYRSLSVTAAYISYNFSYNSAADTPFLESAITQHLTTAATDLLVSELIPIRITAISRESNSAYFKDFRTVRVEINTAEFAERYKSRLNNRISKIIDAYRRAIPRSGLAGAEQSLSKYADIAADPSLKARYLDYSELILHPELIRMDKEKRDSVIQKARCFIESYDWLNNKVQQLSEKRDSLQGIIHSYENKIKKLADFLRGKKTGIDYSTLEKELLGNNQGKLITEDVSLPNRKWLNFFSGIRQLSIGSTSPNYSELTVKNINVTGINLEYARRSLYAAFVAGKIDFRTRDYISRSAKRPPEYMAMIRAGWGKPNDNHLFASYYAGKKQVYGNAISSIPIAGVSIEGQLRVGKSVTLVGEVAKSAPASTTIDAGNGNKRNERWNDQRSIAYSAKMKSVFPLLKSKFEAGFNHTGISFQSFSTFRQNSSINGWYASYDQSFLSRQVLLSLSVRKNIFDNPLLLQPYGGNTVFKSATVQLRKKGWPVVTAGFQPFSQRTSIDSAVYDNIFQTLQGSLTHQYPIGIIQASTVISTLQFFNRTADTSFLYYNALNISAQQYLYFNRYTASLTYSIMNNSTGYLTIMDGGVRFKIFKNRQVGGGVKVHHLNNDRSKIGYYLNSEFEVNKVGSFTIWMEKSYLPGYKATLIPNAYHAISFSRQLKFKKQ